MTACWEVVFKLVRTDANCKGVCILFFFRRCSRPFSRWLCRAVVSVPVLFAFCCMSCCKRRLVHHAKNWSKKKESSQESWFYPDHRRLLIRKSIVIEATWVVDPKSLQKRILNLFQHLPISGLPGHRKMFHTLRQTYYSTHMTREFYMTIAQCASCAQNGIHYRRKRRLQLFPVEGSLRFFAIDILPPLPKTRQRSQYGLAITERYSKLKRAIATSNSTASHVENLFFDHRIVLFGFPTYLLTDDGPQFGSNFHSVGQ